MTLPGHSHVEALIAALPFLDTDRLQHWGDRLAEQLSAGARLLVAGNGGSAAEAQHLTSELVGRYGSERQPLSAMALHTDSSSYTAIVNDYGAEHVFARQVRAHGRPGDFLLLLSTSGTSMNVLAAAEAGRELGLEVWAMTGPAPNPLAASAAEAICIHTDHLPTVQECHLVAIHLLCAAVDRHLSGSEPAVAEGAAVEPGELPRLVVVGDVMLDRDVVGTVDRLSPEAPVPIVSGAADTSRPGGAGMAAILAVRESRWRVTLVCGLGHDAQGAQIRTFLAEAGVETIDLATGDGRTPVKTRVRAADRTLVRFDTDTAPLTLGPLPRKVSARLHEAAAVLVCDYGRGITAHQELRSALTNAAANRPLVWDPHPEGTVPVPGTSLAVPSDDEAIRLTEAGPRDIAGDAERATTLLRQWPVNHVAITRGGGGAILIADPVGHPLVIPARPVAGDTCGAGDQLAVTSAMMLGAGRLPSHAMAAAVEAATRFVDAGGPASLTSQIAKTPTDALELAVGIHTRGGKVVGAGGCFDLLHAGHLFLLDQARRLGDALIVCINSNESVRRLKGQSRPVVDERERAALLLGLDCVDGVLIFHEDTPEVVLAALRPDIWVKGGDYTGQRLAEADLVESWGGEVVTVPYLDGYSTTTRIRQLSERTEAP